MGRSRRWVRRSAVAVALWCVSAGSLAPVLAAVECQADLQGDYRSDEVHDQYVDKVFLVRISTTQDCAKVYFDLITTEQLFNGEDVTSTDRMWRKVNAGVDSATKIKHRIARDSTLVRWEFKQVRCVVCGTE